MAHSVTLIPGDGTGPELVEATRRVLEATGVEFDWDEQAAAEDLRRFIEELDGSTIREHSGISIKPISVFGSERIVESAFEYAKANGRGKVTAAHKANIMKFSDGLFLEVARQVAERHPEIEFEDRI